MSRIRDPLEEYGWAGRNGEPLPRELWPPIYGDLKAQRRQPLRDWLIRNAYRPEFERQAWQALNKLSPDELRAAAAGEMPLPTVGDG
jgi:hypothetical protein